MTDLNENKGYSIVVFILAILDMVWAVLDMSKLHFVSEWWFLSIALVIEGFFIFDYVARMVQAEKKWAYIRHSMFDFIALISIHPVLTFFRLPRVIELTRLPQLVKKTKLYQKISKHFTKVSNFLYTNGLVHVLYINFFAIIISSVLVYVLEKGITFPTFGDAVWWAFVTVTTVGYGDYVPKTIAGRTVAVVLMIVGIGLLSMLTGTVATYFSNLRKEKTNVQKDLDQLKTLASSMSEEELDALVATAEKIKASSKSGSDNISNQNNDQENPPEAKI